jgi:hypothetical protein
VCKSLNALRISKYNLISLATSNFDLALIASPKGFMKAMTKASHDVMLSYDILPRYKHKRNHDKTGMLLYAGECFVLEVCGAKSV